MAVINLFDRYKNYSVGRIMESTDIDLGLFNKSDLKILNYDKYYWIKNAFKDFKKSKFKKRKVEDVEAKENFETCDWYKYYKAVKWYKSRFFFYIEKSALTIPR